MQEFHGRTVNLGEDERPDVIVDSPEKKGPPEQIQDISDPNSESARRFMGNEMTENQRCFFCGESFKGMDQMMNHIMARHQSEIMQFLGNMSSSNEGDGDGDDFLDSIGQMAGMLLGQLGPMLGQVPGKDLEDIFKGIQVEGDIPGDTEDFDQFSKILEGIDGEQLSNVLKLGIQIDLKGGEGGDIGNLGIEPDNGENDNDIDEGSEIFEEVELSELKVCPHCSNFIKETNLICPFCNRNTQE